MADIVIARGGERGGHARLTVLDGEFRTLAVKEVTLVLANEAAGIEAIRRRAVREDVQAWRVDGIHVPLAGRWTVGVEVLVSDFERVTVEDTVALPRLP